MRPPFVFKDAPGLLTLPLALMLFAIAVVFRRLPIVALVAVILGIGLVVLPFLPRQGHATRRAADAASETDLVCRGTLYWHGGGWWRLPSWATNGPLGELRVSPTGIRIGVQPWLGGSLFFPPPIEVPLSEIRSLSRARWHVCDVREYPPVGRFRMWIRCRSNYRGPPCEPRHSYGRWWRLSWANLRP